MKTREMKAYTVIYTDGRMYGSHYSAITKFARIETDDLVNTIKEYDGAVWFVFEGHPALADMGGDRDVDC